MLLCGGGSIVGMSRSSVTGNNMITATVSTIVPLPAMAPPCAMDCRFMEQPQNDAPCKAERGQKDTER